MPSFPKQATAEKLSHHLPPTPHEEENVMSHKTTAPKKSEKEKADERTGICGVPNLKYISCVTFHN